MEIKFYRHALRHGAVSEAAPGKPNGHSTVILDGKGKTVCIRISYLEAEIRTEARDVNWRPPEGTRYLIVCSGVRQLKTRSV